MSMELVKASTAPFPSMLLFFSDIDPSGVAGAADARNAVTTFESAGSLRAARL
jgi:hypothetical protein